MKPGMFMLTSSASGGAPIATLRGSVCLHVRLPMLRRQPADERNTEVDAE
jgi:hypothetical protein